MGVGWYCLGVGCEITLNRSVYPYRPVGGSVWVLGGIVWVFGCDITLGRWHVYPYRPVGGIVWVLGGIVLVLGVRLP